MVAYQIVENGDLNVGALLATVAVALSVIIGLGGLVATIWAIARVKGIDQSIEMLNEANAGLRLANDDLRAEMVRSAAECAERVSKLEATNEALTDGLGQRLAEAIAARFEVTMSRVADRIVEGVVQRSADREQRFREGT